MTFNALRENQRPALQLDGNWILVAWASHGDNGPYHGWLVAFDKTTLQPVAWFNDTTPNGSEAGIWQSGDPPAVDPATGAIYFATGNGTFDEFGSDPENDYGESVIRLNPTPVGNQFVVQDFFTPYEFQTLNNNDADLGSGGTMLLPDCGRQRGPPASDGRNGQVRQDLSDRPRRHGRSAQPGHRAGRSRARQSPRGRPASGALRSFLQINSTTGIIYYHGSGAV